MPEFSATVSHDPSFGSLTLRVWSPFDATMDNRRRFRYRTQSTDHALGHPINRAVGTEGTVQVDIFQGDSLPGDIFLLCADGLAGLMSGKELEDALQDLAVSDLEKKSAELVAIAHERGAPDNVTLCFLAVEDVA